MTSTAATSQPRFQQEQAVWQSLKEAIATSSGFQRWQEQQQSNSSVTEANIDIKVRRYLRETLETLAY